MSSIGDAIGQITDPGDFFGARGAESAAEGQAQSAREANLELARQFDITRGDLQPRIEAGNVALNQQRILLGLGGTDQNAGRRQELQSKIDSLSSQERTGSRSEGLSSFFGADVFKEGSQPVSNTAQIQKLQAELDSIGAGPQGTAQEQQAQAFQQLQESPGQRFIRERQQRALLRNQSAIGGLGGGNVRTALQQQAAGFAQQDIQNQFGRLGQIAGQGQSSAVSAGQFGSDFAGSTGANLRASANAIASGQQAQQQATSNLIGTAAGVAGAVFSDERLKRDIVKLYDDEISGVYRFKYLWSGVEYIGRMAQELLSSRPDAVSLHETGYYQVTPEFAPRMIQ